MSTLVEIAPTPTAENSAIHLHPSDNVAIARVSLSAGRNIRVAGRDLTLRRDVPAGHKVAVRPVPKGDNLIRYGQVIGRARRTSSRAITSTLTTWRSRNWRPRLRIPRAGDACPAAA